MGLLDIFLSKEKRDERSRSKNAQRAINKYAQSPDRLKALEALADDGSDEALFGLLRRFGMTYDKSIEDEQEKEWVFEVLVGKGAAAIPAIKRYLFSADSVAWPLRVLDKVAEKDQEIAILEEVLARHEPGYERDPTKKMQLLAHLGGLKHGRAAALAVPYLKDMDESVRFAAVEAALHQKDEATVKGALLELFGSAEEDSLRIRLRIAESIAELGWAVPADVRASVEAKLPEVWALDREGRFKKK